MFYLADVFKLINDESTLKSSRGLGTTKTVSLKVTSRELGNYLSYTLSESLILRALVAKRLFGVNSLMISMIKTEEV